jgi:lysophospholipase
MSDFIRIEGNPPPDGAETFDFRARDGKRLRAAIFPKEGAVAGVVLLAGWKEFIEKYFEVVRDFQMRGFSVFMMDWRGQGRSERLAPNPRLSHLDERGFAAFRDDLVQFVDEIVRPRFSGPLILATHSMGGAPALQLLADGDQRFVAAVLNAPLTRFPQPQAVAAAYRALANIVTSTGGGASAIPGDVSVAETFETSKVTTDRRRHQQFADLQAAAPDARIDRPTFGWLKAALVASDDLHRPKRFAAMRTPTLIVSAEKDLLVSAADHHFIARQSPFIRCETVKGALHEIMMERDECRDAYFRAFDDFVRPLIDQTISSSARVS